MGASAVALRLVIDTNVVVSALVFQQGQLAWLRHAWQAGTVRPLVSQATVQELLRVLSYPKFKLSHEELNELLADYLPFAEVVAVPAATTLVSGPDPDDQKFLELALAANADALVTGDADLLGLSMEVPFHILRPAELARWLA